MLTTSTGSDSFPERPVGAVISMTETTTSSPTATDESGNAPVPEQVKSLDELVVEYCFRNASKSMAGQLETYQSRLADLSNAGEDGTTIWDTVDFLDFATALDQIDLFVPVRFCAWVAKLSDPYIPSDLAERNIQLADLALADLLGRPLECNPVLAEAMYPLLRQAVESSQLLVVDGFFTHVPMNRGKGLVLGRRLHVHRVARATTALQRVQAKQADIDAATVLIEQHPDMRSFLKDELVARLGIQALEHLPELGLGLDAMILQSVGVGIIDNNPGRIHTMAIGASGVGKKLLTRAARLLNFAFTEASASKCTVAGIQSLAVREQGAYVAMPGLIPQASWGTFAIQDFHSVKDKRGVYGVLSKVIEDGELVDSSAAKTVLQAMTAIHLDLNRKTDLNPDLDPQSELEDVGLPEHILSRFDFIVEIERDPKRQARLSQEILGRKNKVGGTELPPREKGRDLQVLIAFLRDQIPVVDVGEEIGERLDAELRNLLDGFTHPMVSDFLARMSFSALKLVGAHARLCGRSQAIDADVDGILPLLEEKVRTIRALTEGVTMKARKAGPMRAKDRQAVIQEHFGNGPFTVKDVVAKYQELGEPGSEETLERKARRDVRRIGHLVEHGKWQLDQPAAA